MVRFRGILSTYPPFWIGDMEIREDLIGTWPKKSLTRYREMIHPHELTGEEDLSEYVIDRRSRDYLDSLQKNVRRCDRRMIRLIERGHGGLWLRGWPPWWRGLRGCHGRG